MMSSGLIKISIISPRTEYRARILSALSVTRNPLIGADHDLIDVSRLDILKMGATSHVFTKCLMME